MCISIRVQFENVQQDRWEKGSNCLLAPLRIGLGYKIWDARTNAITAKVASICMAIFAFTIWLIPTLFGLAAWKISKTHQQNLRSMEAVQAQQQILIPNPPAGLYSNDSLIQAEEIYKKYSNATPNEKIKMRDLLEQAFKELKAEKHATTTSSIALEQAAARIYFLYGTFLYGGDMVAAQRMFQQSLALQLSLAIDRAKLRLFMPKTHFLIPASLEALSKVDAPSVTSYMDNLIMKMPDQEIADIIFSNSTNNAEAFDFAKTMFWVGATYQNIDKYLNDLPRFEKYFGLPKLIFKKIDTPDSRWEVACIIYNTGRLIHYLKHPGDVEGALKTLDEMKPYLDEEGQSLRAQEKRAQIYNITAIEQEKIIPKDDAEKKNLLRSQLDNTNKAFSIADATPGFDSFLRTLFLSNFAYAAYRSQAHFGAIPSSRMVENISADFQEVYRKIEEEKFNHYYHAAFVRKYAEFEAWKRNTAKAKELIDLAESIAKKFPASSGAALEAIAEIRKKWNL